MVKSSHSKTITTFTGSPNSPRTNASRENMMNKEGKDHATDGNEIHNTTSDSPGGAREYLKTETMKYSNPANSSDQVDAKDDEDHCGKFRERCVSVRELVKKSGLEETFLAMLAAE